MECRCCTVKFLILLVLGVVLTDSVISAPHHGKVNTKVLILGAGAAGLAAAKTLNDKGIEDFIILEGSDRIGGRVMSVKFGGKTVEAGAHWVVGKTGNPLYDIVQKYDVKWKVSDWDSVTIRNSDGIDVTDTEGEAAWSKLAAAEDTFIETAKRLNEGRKDMSVRSCLDIGKWRPTSPVENVVEIFDFDFEFGHLPGVYSCFDFNQTKEFIDEVFFLNDDRGYEFLLQKYAEDVLTEDDQRLYLNERVTKIHYEQEKVEVRTETGKEFTADYVIMTFSIGVLKSGDVTFSPKLPDWKIDSLYRVRLENYLGIYLKFPDTSPKFWDDTEFVLNADERRGYYPILHNREAKGLFSSGTNILEMVTFGEEADRVSQLSNSQIISEIMEVLRRIYKDPLIPDPGSMFFKNWRNDPLYRGSFSSVEPGAASPEIYHDIVAPVGRLYFAGEAYDKILSGYVFGAIRSGMTTALEVVKMIKERND